MNCDERNKLFLNKEIDRDDLWPKIKEYESRRFQFRWEFGLDKIPMSPGLITIRGARQIGKSTWLEFKLLDTLEDFFNLIIKDLNYRIDLCPMFQDIGLFI